MKQIFILLMVAMCAAMFTACSKDDDTDPFDAGGEGVLTMTTETVDVDFYVETAKAGDLITIDWGDGNIEEFTTVKEEYEGEVYYRIDAHHIYSKASTHSIKVTGALTELLCHENNLTTLDVSGCTALTELNCGSNNLTTLDVSKNTALTELKCFVNDLTTLDVSGCTALTNLECGDNNLTSLDVSGCTALTRLWCGDNNLTSLDVSGCTALTRLWCEDNNFSATTLNKIFTDLPQGKTINGDKSTVSIGGNPGTATCNKSIIENKGWDVYNY